MTSTETTYVVILIFTDGNKILVEKRTLDKFETDQILIPGGIVENHELNDLGQAIRREAMEELGVIPLDFEPLVEGTDIPGLKEDVILKPFIIKKWKGNLPNKILDKGNPLIWVEIEKALQSPIKPTRKIVKRLKRHLSKKA